MDIAKGEQLDRIAELCGTKRKYLGLESDRALRKRLIRIIRGTVKPRRRSPL